MKLAYLFLLICGLAAVSAISVPAKKGSSGFGSIKPACFGLLAKLSPSVSSKSDGTATGQAKIPKIVRGNETARNEVPHHLGLSLPCSNCKTRANCGASIINDKFALTAAHCVVDYVKNPGSVTVLAGYWKLSENNGDESNLQAEKIIVHEGWGAKGNCDVSNDIALIQIKGTFNLSSPAIRPVRVVESGARPSGNATVTGWGMKETGQYADVLMKADVAILHDAACKTYGRMYNATTMMCAGMQYKDACVGDSGGALVQKIQGGGVKQVGIVSWGSGCGKGPIVYTRLSYYHDWILRKLAEAEESHG